MAIPQQDPGYGQKKELANLGLAQKEVPQLSGRRVGRPAGRPSGQQQLTARQAQGAPPDVEGQGLTPEQRQVAVDYGAAARAFEDAQAWVQQEPNNPWLQMFATLAEKGHDYHLLKANHALPDYNIIG